MEQDSQRLQAAPPSLALWESDEEVVLHVWGFAVLQASFESEGYYDEAADGDPEEQDLYRVEVLDARRAAQAAEAIGEHPVWPLADLGLADPVVFRLFPASRWTPGGNELLPVKRYLLVLARAFLDAVAPEVRQRVLEVSAGWSPDLLSDAVADLPAEWRAILSSAEAGP